MSIPINHEDLQKLRLFLEFCSKNPTILNTEPLQFVKDFIEKFERKVPEGEFKPSEGKCPFSGSGIKTEPSPEEPEVDSEPKEAEISDLESELELDNEVIYGKGARIKRKLFAVNIPKKRKSRKAREKKSKKVSSLDESISSTEVDIKQDPLALEDKEDKENEDSAEQPEHEISISSSSRSRRATKRGELTLDEVTGDLSVGRPRKYKECRKRYPRAITCSQNCKHECGTHINDERRRELCDDYWSRSPTERTEFIRNSTETLKIKRICAKKTNRPSREFTRRYFLPGPDLEKRRVCGLFYLSTLSISANVVKEALAGMQMNDSLAEKANAETPKKPIPKPIHTNKGKKLNMVRAPRPVNCDVICRTKCTTKISEEQRAQICAAFWALDYKRRKDYVISRVESHATVTKTADEYRKTDRPRSHHNVYFLRNKNGENVRVCLKFFTATLSLGLNYIRETLRRVDPQTGTYIGDDMRRREPTNKISKEQCEEVKRHIESYPTWAPQKRSKMRYLHSSLNIQKMYKEYKQKCIDNGKKFVNDTYFRNVFHKDFRLAFLHTPAGQKTETAKRIKSGQPAPKKRKVNPNISDYTGEEGGFWITPNNEGDVKVTSISTVTSPDENVTYSQTTYTTTTVEPMYANYVQCPATGNIQHEQEPNVFAQNTGQPLLTEYVETRYEAAPTVTRLY